ncbi:MAG: histidine kinase [Candidatus Electrothrix sp. AX5]|nr:histidine kinase [Candidatus Electrothrix sp. AX5]
MEIQAGVGISHHRNPVVAGKEAVEKAREMAGIEKANFVIIFGTVGYDQERLVKSVREATDGAPLCGCSGEGVIVGDEADESNFSVAVLLIRSSDIQFTNGITTGLEEDSGDVGRRVADAVRPEVSSDTLGLFLLMDGLKLNFDLFAKEFERHLDLGRFLPLFGGTSSDNLEFKATYQYCNDTVETDGVAWALISGQAQVAWAVNHGCFPIGVEHEITRCDGNIIYELDNKPALEVLKSYISELETWSQSVTALTLGFKVSGGKENEEYIIRAITGGMDEEKGFITIPTEVEEGTSIWMTRRDHEKITNGINEIADKVKGELDGNSPQLIFQFDCAGRGKSFFREEEKLQLLKTLRQKIGCDVPWIGLYTYGEICPVQERNSFHNFTAVLVTIY